MIDYSSVNAAWWNAFKEKSEECEALRARVERLEKALRNIHKRCYEGSEWERYINLVLKPGKGS